MENEKNFRFAGTVDHLAVKCDDLEKDVEEYKRLGFTLETLYEDWAMMRDAKGIRHCAFAAEFKTSVAYRFEGRNSGRTRSRRRQRKPPDKTAPRRNFFFLHEGHRRKRRRINLLPGRLRKRKLSRE